MENLLISITSPEKTELFQSRRIPPELPLEGEKANLLKCLGASFLMKELSK
jgi:hypothetical protein